MAAILQITEPLPPSFSDTAITPAARPDDALWSYRSGFRDIVSLTCERIDAFFGVPVASFDQRAVARRAVALRAQCVRDDGTSPCLISDLSAGGMAFVCGHVHRVGDRVTLRFESGRGGSVQVDCVVRHVTGPYIGVQFLGVTREQRRHIRPLCSSRRVA
jgi:hypothetical protein